MKIDIQNSKYRKPSLSIQDQFRRGNSWEQITNPMRQFNVSLEDYLNSKRVESGWEINEEEWLYLIEMEREDQKHRRIIKEAEDDTVIVTHGEDNNLKRDDSPRTSWGKYMTLLSENGFDDATINKVGDDAEKVLQKLDLNNSGNSAIKGLVVGSVQSGKTTNMGALMAMSADKGWNVFIVLTGMIENLRKQTENRLYTELVQTNGSVNWNLIENPTIDGRTSILPAQLDFRKNQYIIVSLKNATNLRNLSKWLRQDKAKQGQMNVMVIDDESDQASVNTTDLKANQDRTSINSIIMDIVNGPDNKVDFNSMNYIGYTATPYANVLSESITESLYPKDFVILLARSNKYLGPTQIFGVNGMDEYPGMNIINNTDLKYENETQNMLDLQKGHSRTVPDGLKEAVAYFIGASASLRKHNYKKPLSMLVHNNVSQLAHDNVGNGIREWLASNKEEVIQLVKKIWMEQTSKFTQENFRESVPGYDYSISRALTPHSFDEIESTVKQILDKIGAIQYEDDKYIYHDGIQISIDNSAQNKITDDNEYYRLRYPTSNDNDTSEFAPIFLVVGGATLSRGLTLEGLICTYFSRNAGQADSLMQMGRWFGYRVGYETYPRIWLSTYTLEQFQYLAELDNALREEITTHSAKGKTPLELGIRIRTAPKTVGLKVTSSNKQRGAIESDYDYTGASLQTTIFSADMAEIQDNNTLVSNFIDRLNSPIIQNSPGMSSVYWNNVKFNEVKHLLKNYKFNSRFRMGNNINSFINWIQKNTDSENLSNWNVIAIGKGEINSDDNNWSQKYFNWNMVERSKIIDETSKDYRIQSLRGPGDLFKDIKISEIHDEQLVKLVKKGSTKDYLEIRERLGLETTPQLMIYKIDKNSKAGKNSTNREDLNAVEDIFGLYISIPGGRRNTDYVTHLVVNLEYESLIEEEYPEV